MRAQKNRTNVFCLRRLLSPLGLLGRGQGGGEEKGGGGINSTLAVRCRRARQIDRQIEIAGNEEEKKIVNKIDRQTDETERQIDRDRGRDTPTDRQRRREVDK